jgi:hypothetical protein
MLHTSLKLVNEDEIDEIIKGYVEQLYHSTKENKLILASNDIDLYLASTDDDEFEETLLANFELDEDGDPVDDEAYRNLKEELNNNFVRMVKESELFDTFPAGSYEVNGETRQIDKEMYGPKDVFYAPFEDAVKE